MWHEKINIHVRCWNSFFLSLKTFSLCPDAFSIAWEKAGDRMWASSKLLCVPSVNLLWLLPRFKSASFFWIISYGFWGPRTPHCKTLSRSASHPLDLLSSNLLHQTYEDCFLFAGLCESPAVKVFYMVATFSAPKVFSLSKTQKIGCALLCALALLQVAHTHERRYLS